MDLWERNGIEQTMFGEIPGLQILSNRNIKPGPGQKLTNNHYSDPSSDPFS